MRVVYCDCWAGASGDMILGALLGAGAGLERFNAGRVPAPATLELMRGWVVWDPGERQELVAPTGTAILTTIGTQRLSWPSMTVEAISLGAGSRDAPRPNLLRAVLGTEGPGPLEGRLGEGAGHDTAVVCETSVDDATGQVVAHAVERLLAKGALDAWWSSCGMKKGRPGTKVAFLSRPEDVAGLVGVAFQELPTLGIRTYPTDRSGKLGTRLLTATPAFRDDRALAEAQGVPVRGVIRAVGRASVSRESTGGFRP